MGQHSLTKVVLAGGSGYLGSHLAARLASAGHEVVVLTRSASRCQGPLRLVQWDGRTVGDWADELDGDDVRLVNLAGKLIDVRPTRSNIAELRASRIDSTAALVAAAKGKAIRDFVHLSTVSIFSDGGDELLTESSPLPVGAAALPQMTGIAQPWEEVAGLLAAGRTTLARTSIVLSADATAYQRLAGLARWGVGGTVGSGRQWFSWIHLDDWVEIVVGALRLGPWETPDGVLHVTAPNPVPLKELSARLRERHAPRLLGRPLGLPAPAPITTLGGLLMGTDPALALTGRRVISERLDPERFRYPRLAEALEAIPISG